MPHALREWYANDRFAAFAPAQVMTSIALIAHRDPDAVFAYRDGVATRARTFLADAANVARRMPEGKHVLNVCRDRYRFTVGFAACVLTQRMSLLPSTHTAQVIRQLTEFAPDVFCMTDDPACDIDLPQFHYAEESLRHAPEQPIPEIDAQQCVACVFTSGSTGAPIPHTKTWGRLFTCVREGARRLDILDGRSYAMLGTVPAQHMYGFESTVLSPLHSGNALCAERPFYPADICSNFARLPRPRVLVSTPIHLRTLLATDLAMPEADLVVSATAPLSRQLAISAEQRFHSPLIEVYGSTETGQIATRRTAHTSEWQLWSGVQLRVEDGRVSAHGGHIEQLTFMGDVIEITGPQRFLLHGRTEDLINIAGKRGSLSHLNHQLNAIPGVLDGVFFLREQDARSETGVSRLAALVVAPSLDAASLLEQLRERIDPVFLPRPLLFVERLPRSASGKLPREALLSLAERTAECAPADITGPWTR
jgi:acyl-coenzyme A synthetase/AMP-(fatty) acid ligase